MHVNPFAEAVTIMSLVTPREPASREPLTPHRESGGRRERTTVSEAATLKSRFGIASLGRRMDAAHDLSSCLDSAAVAGPAPLLPTVALSASTTLRAPLRATSQPEMHALAAAGGVPAAHVDPRSGEERVKSWLRYAQELESVRVIA